MGIQTVHVKDGGGVQHTYRIAAIESGGRQYLHTFEESDDGQYAGHDYRGAGEPSRVEERDEPPETAVETLTEWVESA